MSRAIRLSLLLAGAVAPAMSGAVPSARRPADRPTDLQTNQSFVYQCRCNSKHFGSWNQPGPKKCKYDGCPMDRIQ